MFTGNRLDYGVNTFSNEGRLYQVEYALEAIKLGSTALGIQTKEGVLLAVEKRVESKLMVPASNKKIMEIDSRSVSLSPIHILFLNVPMHCPLLPPYTPRAYVVMYLSRSWRGVFRTSGGRQDPHRLRQSAITS